MRLPHVSFSIAMVEAVTSVGGIVELGQPAAMFYTGDVNGDYERIKASGVPASTQSCCFFGTLARRSIFQMAVSCDLEPWVPFATL